VSSTELGRLPAGHCLCHLTCPTADPAGNLAASFHPKFQGVGCGAETSVSCYCFVEGICNFLCMYLTTPPTPSWSL